MSAPKKFRFNIENENSYFNRHKKDDWRETAKKISNFERRTFPQETYYIVQYNRNENKQLKQLVVKTKDTVVSGFHNDNDDDHNLIYISVNGGAPIQKRLQQVFISDDGFAHLADVIDEATTYEKACDRLQQLKKDCFKLLFKCPGSPDQYILPPILKMHKKFKKQASYLLIQYNCGLDSVIYDIAHRSDSILQNEYQLYVNNILYRAKIIKFSHDVLELAEDLKFLTRKCLHLRYERNIEITVKAESLGTYNSNTNTLMRPISSISSLQIMRPAHAAPNVQPLKILRPLPIYPQQIIRTFNDSYRTSAMSISRGILHTFHRENRIEDLEQIMEQESTELAKTFRILDVAKRRLNLKLNLLNNKLDEMKQHSNNSWSNIDININL